jgi:tetratricopeptide (TPR) repeat protein
MYKLNISKKNIFFFLSTVVLISMLSMSTYFGPSNDESFQVPYGKQALDYYVSFGKNDSVLDYKPEPLMKNYGAIVDMIPEAIHRLVGSDLMNTRHFVFAFISFFYIFFGALIAKRIAGWNAGIIAIILLTFLPRIFGESMNNPKDPPYAATYLISIYAFMYFFDHLKNISKRSIFILFIGFMSTMLVRVSGLMAVFYFGLFLIWEYLSLKKENINIDEKNVIFKIGIAGACGYFISIFFWPSMMNAPFTQPIDALNMLKQYPITLRNLWEGQYIQSNTIPWYYNPKYFLISNPEITLIGIFASFMLLPKLIKVYNIRRISLLLFAGLFPIFLIIYNKTALLTGWRHSYFMFVPFVIFASIGFAYLIDYWAVNKIKKYFIISLICIGILPTAIFMVKHFPYFYVYFNPTFGGAKKAMGNFELDYYSHSLKPATDWLVENEPNLKNLNIVSNNPYQVNEILKQKKLNFGAKYLRYRERNESDWDYAILTQSFIDAEYLRNGYFPPKGTVKTIDVDGVPICAIVKREDKNDYYGKLALDSGQFNKAIDYFNKALKYDPNNEIAWTNLGMALLQSGQAGASIDAFKNAEKISPENIMTLNGLAYAYLNTNEVNYAKITLEKLIEQNPNYAPAYDLLSKIYASQGNAQMAQQYEFYYKQLSGQ